MPSRSETVFLLMIALATAACDKQTASPEQANVAASGATPDEVTTGASATAAKPGEVDRSRKGELGPTLAFRDAAGNNVSLADFRGRPVLLNLWATWCAPCIKEMPSLDALAAASGDKLHVITVSQDMQPEKVAPFFKERELANLAPYTDPDMGLSLAYKVNLPTTIMFDAEGREQWRLSGAMEWDGPEAKALIDGG